MWQINFSYAFRPQYVAGSLSISSVFSFSWLEMDENFRLNAHVTCIRYVNPRSHLSDGKGCTSLLHDAQFCVHMGVLVDSYIYVNCICFWILTTNFLARILGCVMFRSTCVRCY